MMHEGESSILKSLAVAFGDGLAFGVGVKIAQGARKRTPDATAEPAVPAAVPIRAESAEPIDLQVLSKVLAAIDTRLSKSEAQLAADLKGFDARQTQQNSRSQAALEEIHASMMDRVSAVERSAQTVEARLAEAIRSAVESRIQQYVDAQVRKIEERLHHDI